jgi:hypothetical protein
MERNMDGDVIFNGPRIRMGVHWAAQGTVASHYSPAQRAWQFAGPGWAVAAEISEAAHGGQVRAGLADVLT